MKLLILIVAMFLLVPKFQLGMTFKQASELCPTPLITAYDKLYINTHFICDDKVNTTVLIFDQEKLAAIIDLRYFARGK